LLFFSETLGFSGGIKSEATVLIPLKIPFLFYYLMKKIAPISAVHVHKLHFQSFQQQPQFSIQFMNSRNWESKKMMMLCLGIVGGTTKCLQFNDSSYRINNKRFIHLNKNSCFNTRWRLMSLESDSSSFSSSSIDSDKNSSTGYSFYTSSV
jgi:trehalose/maltose hydrolase-like predicted phosphorylase